MYTFCSILIVVASIVLVFFVIIQNSKGGGLAAGFSSSNQVMGVRKTTDFLEKATWILAAIVVLCSIFASIGFRSEHSGSSRNAIEIPNIAPAADPNATAPFGTAVPQPATEQPAE
ncbi:MAG: preprotein translocase subunit SecG [Dysgonamonadaceae bacterium]|jgi:preprotein translocase subunit SecG|nr:preprotein translocase subunit SecG [Dysgonamonadaceae bacterium]